MLKDITLGKFTYNMGGHIYLAPGENMEYGLETASCMHELYHANLALSSNIGLLMHMIELEIGLSQDDWEYKYDLIRIRDGLYDATRAIQEVYANSLELLWIEENYGIETRQEVYIRKTDEYKQYLKISEKVWNNKEETIEVRRKQINCICNSILNLNIHADSFWLDLNDYVKHKSSFYLDKMITSRMDYAFQNQKCIEDSKQIEQNEIVEIAHNRFRYLGDKLEQAFEYSKNFINANLTELLLENISTFEFSELKIKRGKQFDSNCDAVCVIHDVQSGEGVTDTCLIQHFAGKNLYEIVEVNNKKINQILGVKKYVIIPYEDFSFAKNRTKRREFQDKVVFVLINNAREFKKWLYNFREYEEVYIGNINAEGSSNFFTVIYFRKRSYDKVIYMFPTLSIIANNIFKELGIEQEVKYTGNGMGFYNIFSVFNDWGEIFKALKETISFVTGSKGNIIHNENPCARIFNWAKFDIGDNIFRIVGKNYFHINSVLPTLQTKAMPFWILMEFENGENNGNVKCEGENSDNSKLSQKKSGVIYFYDKESAVSYRRQMVEKNPELESYQIVGLDELFWKELKPCLQIKKMGMIFLSGNSDEGIWYDLEQFEYLQMCGMK